MTDYVKIVDGNVSPIIITKTFAIQGYEDKGIKIIDVTDMEPKPTFGWTYSDNKFHMPVIKYAILKDNVIDKIVYINEIDASFLREEGKEVREIQNMIPQPQIGWIFNGSHFEEYE